MSTRKMKRFATIAAIAMIASCMAAPLSSVYAAEPLTAGDVTIVDTVTGRKYEAYQIFDGNYSDGVMSNIVWGSGIDSTKYDDLIADLRGIDAFADCDTPAKVATELAKITAKDDPVTVAFAAAVGKYLDAEEATELTAVPDESTTDDTTDIVGYKATGLDLGYYLIKDKDDSQDGAYAAYTSYIVEVLGSKTDVKPKRDIPTVVKKVKENKDIDTDYLGDENYNDVADYNIGDMVPFKVYGTMPSSIAGYEAYYLKFTDTLGKEFVAPEAEDIVVKIDGRVIKERGSNVRVNVTANADGSTKIEVSIEDVLAYGATAGSLITFEYEAELDTDAEIGLPGQINEVYLEFSNNPNEEYKPTTSEDKDGDGKLDTEDEDENDNGVLDEGEDKDGDGNLDVDEDTDNDGELDKDETDEVPDDQGKTEKDVVIVFTYELDTTKVDGANTTLKLDGAEFKFFKEVVETEGVALEEDAEPTEVEVTNRYYVIVNGDSKVTDWVKATRTDKINEEKTGVESSTYAIPATASTLTSAETTGLFKVVGIDEGTYYLEETKAPDKYNILAAPVEVVITAKTLENTTDDRQDWKWSTEAEDAQGSTALTELTVLANSTPGTTDLETGAGSITIGNNKGNMLPSTGGIGTTIFYVVGGTMAAGAGVYLISKKRMKKEEE